MPPASLLMSARTLALGLADVLPHPFLADSHMSFFLFAAGLAVIGLGVFLLKVGLPKDGHIRSSAALGVSGELYAFAIIISLVVGMGLILNAVLLP